MAKSTRSKSPKKMSVIIPYKEAPPSLVFKTTRSNSRNHSNTPAVKEVKSPLKIKQKLKKKKKLELVITKEALRPRKGVKFVWKMRQDTDSDFEYDDSPIEEKKVKKKIKRTLLGKTGNKKEYTLEDFEDVYEDENVAKKQHIEEVLDKIPRNKKQLQKLYEKVEERLVFYKKLFISQQVELEKKKSHIAEDAIPICSDVRTFEFKKLAEAQKKFGGRLFDVIMMDPPWQLSSSQPSRGVAIAYESLSDELIQKMPIASLQDNGFIFLWTINAKYAVAAKLIEHWGYKLVDEVTWIKKTINGKIAKGHGFYLQHAKESCLIGVKGKVNNKMKKAESDVIFSQRRGQSQKPEEVYALIENLVPNGFYLEIFGRRNNLRSKWTTIGNEL